MQFVLDHTQTTVPVKLKRLKWFLNCFRGLKFLCGDIIADRAIVSDCTDPLSFLIFLNLIRPLQKTSKDPFRVFVRHFANEADCFIPVIKIAKYDVCIEVLIKNRHRPMELINEQTNRST